MSEILHHRLGHISTRSLISGYTANVCQDIELRIYPDPFYTSCQIFSTNKKAISKNPLKPKVTLKLVLWILFQQQHQTVLQVKILFLIVFELLMNTQNPQNVIV